MCTNETTRLIAKTEPVVICKKTTKVKLDSMTRTVMLQFTKQDTK